MGKLTELKIRNLAEPGRYGDGDGLWFQVRKADADRAAPEGAPAKSWLFRYTWQGKQRQLGLGPYPTVGLKAARDAAHVAARAVREGMDPIAAKRLAKADAKVKAAAMTFREVLELYLAAHEETWKNPKHRQQWRNTLTTYVLPVFGDKAVAAIDTGAVMQVIEPIWKAKPETAARVRGRIETVLDYAAARGWRIGDNPARWRGHVENLLPKRSKVAAVEHHAALPWAEIGAFMRDLELQEGIGALAMRFTILTAARTGETIGARWREIDMQGAVWTVPAERMKAGEEHRVPLSDAALDVIRAALPLRSGDDGYVFPGRGENAPLSNMAMTATLRRMERGNLTVHGFRSTFRDWCAEKTNTPRELAEVALAHTLKNKTEASYQRGKMFEKRRMLMASWARFCAMTESQVGEIIAFAQVA